MRMLQTCLGLALAAPLALAQGYGGATAGMRVGPQFEFDPLPTAGGEAFVGKRIWRFVSIELFYALRFTLDPIREPGEGRACSGDRTDWWRTQSLGLRLWFRVVENDFVTISVGPSASGGIAVDRNEPLRPVICGPRQTFVKSAPAASAAVPVAFEMHLAPWLYLRAILGPSLDFGWTNPPFAMLSLGGEMGPVVRF